MTAAQDSRAQFEAWARSYGTWEVVRDDDLQLGTTGYTDVELTIAWHAVQASRAALSAEPVTLPEPAGYRWLNTHHYRQKIKAGHNPEDWTPLFTEKQVRAMLTAAPQPAAQERKPLTDEQIAGLDRFVHGTVFGRFNRAKALCRATERAHGITGEAE